MKEGAHGEALQEVRESIDNDPELERATGPPRKGSEIEICEGTRTVSRATSR